MSLSVCIISMNMWQLIGDLPASVVFSIWVGCIVDISVAVAAAAVVVTLAVVSASSAKKINRLNWIKLTIQYF